MTPVTAPGLVAGLLVLATAVAARLAARVQRGAGVGARLAAVPAAPGLGRVPRPIRLASGPGRWAPAWVGSALADTGAAAPPALVWRAWTASIAFAVGAGLVVGPGAAAVAAAVAVAGPGLAWRLLRHRGDQRFDAALPAAVEAVARSLRTGASLRQALAEAARATPGPVGADLAGVAAAVERGSGVVPALEAWAERRPLPSVCLVVAAVCLGAEAGGARAEAIDGVAASLRRRQAAAREVRALAAQARASALVIAVAPLAFCALASATDARTSAFLLGTPAGLLLLTAGLALDAAGALWMARLTRIEP